MTRTPPPVPTTITSAGFVVLASVVAMIVRLPAAAVDVFIAANLAFAVAIVLVALYVDHAARLTSLPSLPAKL